MGVLVVIKIWNLNEPSCRNIQLPQLGYQAYPINLHEAPVPDPKLATNKNVGGGCINARTQNSQQ